MNGYFQDINKYLRLVPTNKSKEEITKFEELRIKIRDLARSKLENQIIMIILMKNI